jgi:hypothetical protein
MKPLLLDVMLNGRFVCQLKYEGMTFHEMIDGKVVPVYDADDMKRFVYEQRPSLRGKDIKIEFSSQIISP